MLQRVNSSTVSKLVGTVLDLLDTDRLPQGAGETSVVSWMPVVVVADAVVDSAVRRIAISSCIYTVTYSTMRSALFASV